MAGDTILIDYGAMDGGRIFRRLCSRLQKNGSERYYARNAQDAAELAAPFHQTRPRSCASVAEVKLPLLPQTRYQSRSVVSVPQGQRPVPVISQEDQADYRQMRLYGKAVAAAPGSNKFCFFRNNLNELRMRW